MFFSGFSQGDRRRASAAFFAFFFLIVAYAGFRPLRSALVLDGFGATVMPYLWSSTGLLVLGFVLIYGPLLDRFSARRILVFSNTFFIVTFSLLVLLHVAGWKMARLGLYVWSDIMSVVMAEQIWSYLDDHFKTSQAKKVYGPLASGGVLGGVVGSYLSSTIIRWHDLGTFFFVIFLLVAFYLPASYLRSDNSRARESSEFRPRKKPRLTEGFSLIAANRYLQLILLIVVLTQLTSNLIDFQFNSYIEKAFHSTNARVGFLGPFFATMNLLSFAFTMVLTPLVHRYLGIRPGLLFLPVFHLGMMTLSLLVPGAWILGIKMGDKSLNYSIMRASREILYLPTSREDKYKAKSVIDIFAYRSSEVVAALVISSAPLFLKHFNLTYLSIVLMAALIVVNLQVGRRFRRLSGST